MAKKLIIAEKPSVAADIARALGGFTRKDYFESEEYVLSSAVGHLLELPCRTASRSSAASGRSRTCR
jgi:DNA topoisomerase III